MTSTGEDRKECLTLTQLMERWNVGRDTARVMAPTVPGAFRIGRQLRFPLWGVERYEAENQIVRESMTK